MISDRTGSQAVVTPEGIDDQDKDHQLPAVCLSSFCFFLCIFGLTKRPCWDGIISISFGLLKQI